MKLFLKKNILIITGISFFALILVWVILYFLFPVSIIDGEKYNTNKLTKINRQRELAYNKLYISLNDEIYRKINNLYIESLNNEYSNADEIVKNIIYNGDILLLGNINFFNLLYLSKEELRILRNTIYAKYGYVFQSKDLSEHFNRFIWYEPQYNNVDEKLTEYDMNIVEIIRKVENGQIKTNIQGILELFYTKSKNIDKYYYQLMSECKNKISFPLQNKKLREINDIFPAYINAVKYNDQYYNEFTLKLLIEQYESIIKKIIEEKTKDIIEYIDYYSNYSEIDVLTIAEFIGSKYYYEIINESLFDYYLNQCIINDKILGKINISIENSSDYSLLDIPVIIINDVYYASVAIDELQKSMGIVSPYIVENTKNIFIEGIDYQTEIYAKNIDSYADWFYSYFTTLGKTWTNIIGFITGKKSSEEKYFTDNFNRIMNKNTNFDLIIREDVDKQNNIINNIFSEYLGLKNYFSVDIRQNAVNTITDDDFIEPFIDDITLYYDQVFETLNKANNYYFQDYTINNDEIVNTAKNSAKLLSSVNFFGGILIDYLTLKTQELLNKTELKQKIFNSMIDNQNKKIEIINNPFNYMFDKLSIGSVLFVDNYFAGLNTYQHYGVYIGNGNVIHFAPLEGQEISMENGIIHETTLEKFLDGRALKININIEKKFNEKEIVERTRSRLGEKGYNLFTNNCEHFARWCVTGESVSYQIDNLPQKVDNTLLIVQEKFTTISKFIELFR